MATRHVGATHEGVRRQNLGTLMRIVHHDGSASRSELTAATGLNRSTVGALSTELVALQVVRESRGASIGVGRPSISVQPRPDRVMVLAVNLRVGMIVVALVGFGGAVLARRELVTAETPTQPPSRLVNRMARLGRRMLDDNAADARCIGIGVGVPGLVHHDEDVVREAPNLGWIDVPLGAMLRSRLGTEIPIWVRNDADLGALAEHTRGAAHLIYLAGEAGVGGGVIVANRVLAGSGGYAGEIGHMQVNPRGRRCRCGGRGCWETEVGEQALLLAAGQSGQGLGAADVVLLAEQGDVAARRAVRGITHWLGVGVANLVNALSPEVVVFGGALRDVLPVAAKSVSAAVGASLVGRRQAVRLVVPDLGGDSTLLGAAEMAFEPLLADPLGVLGPVTAR